MATVRVKQDIACVVYDEQNDMHVALAPNTAFDSRSPIVKAYPWAFESDAQRDRSIDVEDASATPGSRRNR